MSIHELKGDTIIIRLGSSKRVDVVDKKKPPKGTLNSLLPIFQEFSGEQNFEVVDPDYDFWTNMETPYTKEKAVNLLRKAGFGVEETAELLMTRALRMSGVAELNLDLAKDAMRDFIEEKVRDLYRETTESVGPRK